MDLEQKVTEAVGTLENDTEALVKRAEALIEEAAHAGMAEAHILAAFVIALKRKLSAGIMEKLHEAESIIDRAEEACSETLAELD